MSQQISRYLYWLGLVVAVLAVILRSSGLVGHQIHLGGSGYSAASYLTLYRGAVLVFLIAIANQVIGNSKQ